MNVNQRRYVRDSRFPLLSKGSASPHGSLRVPRNLRTDIDMNSVTGRRSSRTSRCQHCDGCLTERGCKLNRRALDRRSAESVGPRMEFGGSKFPGGPREGVMNGAAAALQLKLPARLIEVRTGALSRIDMMAI